MPPLRAVLFDVTGTLIEPAEEVGTTYARVAAQFGVELPAWRLSDGFQRVLRHAPPRVPHSSDPRQIERSELAWWRERVRQTFQATDSTVRFSDFDAFFAQLFGVFASGEAWRMRTGVPEALQEIRAAGLLTGIVSNFDYRLLELLESLGIVNLFDVVMYPHRCGSAKPERTIFLAALGELGVAPGDAIYVGHDPHDDLAAARDAGLRAVDVAQLQTLSDLPARLEALATLRARRP